MKHIGGCPPDGRTKDEESRSESWCAMRVGFRAPKENKEGTWKVVNLEGDCICSIVPLFGKCGSLDEGPEVQRMQKAIASGSQSKIQLLSSLSPFRACSHHTSVRLRWSVPQNCVSGLGSSEERGLILSESWPQKMPRDRARKMFAALVQHERMSCTRYNTA